MLLKDVILVFLVVILGAVCEKRSYSIKNRKRFVEPQVLGFGDTFSRTAAWGMGLAES